jgi:hypothetical protein
MFVLQRPRRMFETLIFRFYYLDKKEIFQNIVGKRLFP